MKIVSNRTAHNSSSDQIFDSISTITKKWFSLHDNTLDGTHYLVGGADEYGLVAGYKPDVNGYLMRPVPVFTSGSQISTPDNSNIDLSGDVTIEFTIKLTNIGSARLNPLDKSYGGEFAFTIEVDGTTGDGSLSYYHGTRRASGYYLGWTALGVGTLQNNVVYTITLVRDHTNKILKSYLNGEFRRSYDYSAVSTDKFPSTSTYPISIGKGYTNYSCQGNIWNVKIWNRVLTDQEVAMEAGKPADIDDSSLKFYMPLDEAVDSVEQSYTEKTGYGSPTLNLISATEIAQPYIVRIIPDNKLVGSSSFEECSGSYTNDGTQPNSLSTRIGGYWGMSSHYSDTDYEVKTDGGFHGNNYVRAYIKDTNWAGVRSAYYDFKDGKWYRVSVRARSSGGGKAACFLPYFGSEDSRNQWVSKSLVGYDNEWVEISNVFQMTGGDKRGFLYCYAHYGPVGGTLDYDSVVVEEFDFQPDPNGTWENGGGEISLSGVTLYGDNQHTAYPVDYIIRLYDKNGTLLEETSKTGNNSLTSGVSFSQSYSAHMIEIEISKISTNNHPLKLTKVALTQPLQLASGDTTTIYTIYSLENTNNIPTTDYLSLNTTAQKDNVVTAFSSDTPNITIQQSAQITNSLSSNDNLNIYRYLETEVIKHILTHDVLYLTVVGESKMTNVHTIMDASLRHIKGKVEITYTDPFLDSTIETDCTTVGRNTYPEQLTDSLTSASYKWFALHDNTLNGTYHLMPDKKLVNIPAGFRDSDLQFYINEMPLGTPNSGEIAVSGTFVETWDGEILEITDNGSVVTAPDHLLGHNKILYIMYTHEATNTRFGIATFHAQHLVAVEYKNSKWYAYNNETAAEFEPRASDLILARFMSGIQWIEDYKGILKEPVDVSYTEPYEVGWWSASASDSYGVFSTPPTVSVKFNSRAITKLKVVGDALVDNYPVDFTIRLLDNTSTVLHIETVTGNNLVEWEKTITPVQNVAEMRLTVNKINKPNQPCKILEFYTLIKETYETDAIQLMELHEEINYNDGTIPIGTVSSNELDVVLDNQDGKFSYGNTNSPLNGLLKRNRKVKAWLGVEVVPNQTEWHPLGTFWTISWNVPHRAQAAALTARDRLDVMRYAEFKNSPVFVDTSLYDIFNYILTDYGLSSSEYYIDTTLQNIIIPYAWFNRTTYRAALQRAAGCTLVQVYCDRDGVIQIKNVAPSQTAIVTLDDDVNVYDSDYPQLWNATVNKVEVVCNTYEQQSNQQVLKAENVITVPAYSTVTKEFMFNTLPVLSVDNTTYDKDASITIASQNVYAWGMEVTFENTSASAAQIRSITAAGTILKLSGTISSYAVDDGAVKEDGEIKETLQHDFIQDAAYAQQLADAILNTYKYSQQDAIYDTRGNIALKLGDRVQAEGYISGNILDYMIIRQHLRWDGSLEAKIEGRKINE